LVFFLSKKFFRNGREFEIGFLIELSNKHTEVLNPCGFSIHALITKAKKNPPKFNKILGCYISHNSTV
jgi:hypothetical protein